MKLIVLALTAAMGLEGCFPDEKKLLPNPRDPLPSYPQFRQPHNGGGYDNLAGLKLPKNSLYSNREFY